MAYPFACKSSGLKSSSAAIATIPASGKGLRVWGLSVEADGTNPATAILYDSTAASGTEVAKVIVDATLTHEADFFPVPVACATGLYLALSGTGAKAIVYYE